MNNPAQGQQTPCFLTFFGPIAIPQTTSFRTAICQLVNNGTTEITILFSSAGGSTDDGIALHTFLRSQPVGITMHAVGVVGSIAIPVFLAADRRFASANASFYFHEYVWNTESGVATLSAIDEQALLLRSAVNWSKDLIKSRTKLTDQDFDTLKLFNNPHLMPPRDAARYGLVANVSEPKIPHGIPSLVVT